MNFGAVNNTISKTGLSDHHAQRITMEVNSAKEESKILRQRKLGKQEMQEIKNKISKVD